MAEESNARFHIKKLEQELKGITDESTTIDSGIKEILGSNNKKKQR